jgi:CMP/dCMP kinase
MTTVTISRDFGSEGDILARKIADNLGYHFVDKEIIGHLLGSYGFVEFDKEYDSLPGFWENFDSQRGKRREMTVEMLNKALQAVAVHGNAVILGRSGFSVLAGYADVFHVRLQAPFQARVRRLMVEEKLTHDEALAVCEEGDKIRSGFVQEFYGISWDTAHAFDLVINIDKIKTDLALRFVVDAVKAIETASRKGKPTTGMIEIDSVLSRAVAEVLRCSKDHFELNPALAVPA